MSARFVKIGDSGKKLRVSATEWVAVYDSMHDLTWSRTLDCGAVNQPKAVEVASALRLFDRKDWLLATRAQLLTLVDDTRRRPAIDIRFFPNCSSGWYWTRTPYASSPSDCAWSVGFNYGLSNWYYQYSGGFVRAVRPGQ